SPGIGIGVAHIRDSGTMLVPEYKIPARAIERERKRFTSAVTSSRRQIRQLQKTAQSMPGSAEEELCLILDAYLQMLDGSRLVRGIERRILENKINAEAAVEAEIAEIAEGFAAIEDAYIAARMADVREVGNRLIQNLVRMPVKALSRLPKGSIVIAEELTPADTARLNPQRIVGAAAIAGGAEGHTAIMARALGIPTVLGIQNLTKKVRSGETVIVDGGAGTVVVNPSPETVELFEKRREERVQEIRQLTRLKRQPAVTRNGTAITLHANVELPIEMNAVKQSGAAGIGLLRTEFMFMNRDDVPDEEDQYLALREIVEAMNGRSVTIRTLDVGGEKISEALIGDMGESVCSPLGLRGIRLSLSRADVLLTQFRAILRAAAHGRVRILLPMVTTASEVRRAREILQRAARQLKRQGIEIPAQLPPCGVMIEVPAAALAADALARVSDFFAVGSNDLTMYTLATDRSDEQVAKFFDSLNPAVLRLMQMAAEAALIARIPVSICGEIAGDPRYSALLLGLGFQELSMTASNIPRVKKRIRALDMDAAHQRARIIMEQVDGGRIAALLDDFNALA
ncbi:MAG: phosphoenolpyruvate--protein phosphotransferase, partial [Rhodospirillales bacterium]|nr:phosphoenolpyruvate--protein phosphotransferase [Rhodospirillales bacterium]